MAHGHCASSVLLCNSQYSGASAERCPASIQCRVASEHTEIRFISEWPRAFKAAFKRNFKDTPPAVWWPSEAPVSIGSPGNGYPQLESIHFQRIKKSSVSTAQIRFLASLRNKFIEISIRNLLRLPSLGLPIRQCSNGHAGQTGYLLARWLLPNYGRFFLRGSQWELSVETLTTDLLANLHSVKFID